MNLRPRHWLLTLVLLVPTLVASPVTVAGGRAVLTVGGAIDGEPVSLSLEDLLAMEPVTVRTRTKWTDGIQVFTGVHLGRLLREFGARGDEVEALALNDYRATLPLDELERYDVIVAYWRNGEPMPVRDKGPLWIVYPIEQHPELDNLRTEHRMVWQLHSLIVR